MSKSSRSFLMCVLILLLTVGAAVGCSSASASGNGLTLQQPDSGKSLTVKSGDAIRVTLRGNPTTGFSWQVVTPDDGKAIVKQVGGAVFQADSSALGAGGTFTFEFQAAAKGEGALKLVYSRPWESVHQAQTFEVTLTVN